FEDPKTYTRPWAGRKIFVLQHGGFEDAYACSMSEYEHFRQSVLDPVTAPKKQLPAQSYSRSAAAASLDQLNLRNSTTAGIVARHGNYIVRRIVRPPRARYAVRTQ